MFADEEKPRHPTVERRRLGEFIFEVMQHCVYCGAINRIGFALCKSNLFLQDHVLHIAELPVNSITGCL